MSPSSAVYFDTAPRRPTTANYARKMKELSNQGLAGPYCGECKITIGAALPRPRQLFRHLARIRSRSYNESLD